MLKPVILVLEIRLRQAWRSARSVGGLWLIGLPLAVVFYLSLLSSLVRQPVEIITTFGLLPPLLIHLRRRDLFFLKKQGFPLRLVLFTEYALLSLLLVVPVASLSGHYPAAGFCLAGSLAIPFLPQWNRLPGSARPWALPFVPYLAFEWRSALRRYRWLFLLFYLPGLGLATYTGAPLLSVVLFAAMLPDVYSDCEPKELMEPFFSRPGGLWRKLGLHAALLLSGLMPLAIIFFIFSPEAWYLMPLALLAALLYQAFAILYKYAHYFPGRRKVHNGITAGLFALGLIVPFLAPACLVYLAVLYRKAKNKVEWLGCWSVILLYCSGPAAI